MKGYKETSRGPKLKKRLTENSGRKNMEKLKFSILTFAVFFFQITLKIFNLL